MTSCTDWLSVAPENDLIKEKFWQKKSDADGALAATYNAFRGASLESLIWGELRADLVTFSGTDFSEYSSIQNSDISLSNSKISWESYYKAINLANTLMFFADKVVEQDKSFTPTMKLAYDAECLYIRALSYFYLVRIWKEVPIVIEASVSDKGDLFKPKNTEKEVIAQIIKDLLLAKDIAYTDEFIEQPEYYKGRANKYSIMTLLADVYLWNEEYQNAINYCDSVINTDKFSLLYYSDWFQLYNPGNSMSESIFEIQYDATLEGQNNPIYDKMIPTPTGSAQVKMNRNTTDRIFQKADQRLLGNYTALWKYIGLSPTSKQKREANQRDANFIYYRYADVLLIKAEALNELDQLSDANNYVRQTLERAGLSHTERNNKEELRDYILDEKAREFALEGKRWFDILRYAKRNNFEKKQYIINMILASAKNIKQATILKTRITDTMSYYLPVPKKDIESNNILEQNPFYDR